MSKRKGQKRISKGEILRDKIEHLETRIDKSLTSLEGTIKKIKEDLRSETKQLMDAQAQSRTSTLAISLLDRFEYIEKEEKRK